MLQLGLKWAVRYLGLRPKGRESIPPKFQPNNAEEPRTQKFYKSAIQNPMKKRVTASHKSRFKAYLSAYKKDKEKSELEDSVEIDMPTSTEKSILKDK